MTRRQQQFSFTSATSIGVKFEALIPVPELGENAQRLTVFTHSFAWWKEHGYPILIERTVNNEDGVVMADIPPVIVKRADEYKGVGK